MNSLVDVPANGWWVTGFKAENFMRLEVVALDEADLGQVVELRGKNEQGKSSMLDAVECVLAGEAGAKKQPLRTGADKGFLELQLGEPGDTDPRNRILVRRTFDAKGASRLTFTLGHTAPWRTPQALLDAIINRFCLDPITFEKSKPAEQRNLLARASKVDLERIAELDKLHNRVFAQRTEQNRAADQREKQATAIQYPDGLPPTPIDEAALTTNLREAGDGNIARERLIALRQNRYREATALEGRALNARDDAEEFRRRAEELERNADQLDAQAIGLRQSAEQIEIPVEIDTAELQAQIEEARRINRAIGERNRRQEIEAEAKAARARSEEMSAALAGYAKEKRNLIAAAEMPVDGLSLGEEGVLWRGVPFEQASGGVRITVSTAIAMACNPGVRVVCVRDGNTLDQDRYSALVGFCRERGFQLWVEFVDNDPQTGIIMEEGRARSAARAKPSQSAQPALSL